MSIGRLGGIAVLAATVLCTVSPSAPQALPSFTNEVAAKTVTAYGGAGTFGAMASVLPSGQPFGKVELPRWEGFAAGRRPYHTVEAGDGTLLMTGLSHNDSRTFPTSGEMVIGAYGRADHTLRTIRLTTTKGQTATVNRDGYPMAPTVSDLLPLPGGAVAFTAWPTLLDRDVERDGDWPVFGVLTKVDGAWRVLPGNQWSGSQIGDPACPDGDCLHPAAMARLPASGDIIVAQAAGALTVIRLTGPDPSGHFSVQVTAHFRYPKKILIRSLSANPTSPLGQERFVIGIDAEGGPGVVQEFSYDSRSGSITAASAPVLPGDLNKAKTSIGYLESLYDRSGNLWVSRRDGSRGGKLAVYTGPLCPHDPTSRAWAQPCPPDYDIVQAKSLPPARGLIEDPATGTVMLLAQGGALLAVRMTSPGTQVAFEVGNVLDLGHKLLATGERDTIDSQLGAVDAQHRLWLPTARMSGSAGGVAIDHWLVSIDIDDLFAPPPIPLPGTPGRSATIQAEHTATIATNQRKGEAAKVDVDSAVFVRPCTDSPVIVGCGYDNHPGDGFYVSHQDGYGHRRGSLQYRVSVPSAGNYRLSYHVATFPVTTTAAIGLTAGGRTYLTPVHTDWDFRQIRATELVYLPAGVQTITLHPPEDRGGWFLNSFTLQRV